MFTWWRFTLSLTYCDNKVSQGLSAFSPFTNFKEQPKSVRHTVFKINHNFKSSITSTYKFNLQGILPPTDNRQHTKGYIYLKNNIK